MMFMADEGAGSNGAFVGEQAEVGGRIATSYRGEGRGTTYRPARVALGGSGRPLRSGHERRGCCVCFVCWRSHAHAHAADCAADRPNATKHRGPHARLNMQGRGKGGPLAIPPSTGVVI